MKFLFYKASEDALIGKLIAWVDGSPYSHVEIVEREDESYYYTIGCHWGRGGVTRGMYRKDDAGVVIVVNAALGTDALTLAQIMLEEQIPYAVHKMFRTLWSWWPCFGNGMICSSFVAECLERPKNDSWGVAAIYREVSGV